MTPFINVWLIAAGYFIGTAIQRGSLSEAAGALLCVLAWFTGGLLQAFRRSLETSM